MLEVKFYKDGEEYKPTPIEVATMLIQKQEKSKAPKNPLSMFLGRKIEEIPEDELQEIETEMFLPLELEEIAEHLKIYTKKYCCFMGIQDSDGSVNEDE